MFSGYLENECGDHDYHGAQGVTNAQCDGNKRHVYKMKIKLKTAVISAKHHKCHDDRIDRAHKEAPQSLCKKAIKERANTFTFHILPFKYLLGIYLLLYIISLIAYFVNRSAVPRI